MSTADVILSTTKANLAVLDDHDEPELHDHGVISSIEEVDETIQETPSTITADHDEHAQSVVQPIPSTVKQIDESTDDRDSGWDTDLEMEDERSVFDISGATIYLETCKILGVVPVSYFVRHMGNTELVMRHHGLGPLGAKALSVPLVMNTSVLTLDLQDNWLEGEGGKYLADMLKENCYITELIISDNKLGTLGASSMCDMLLVNTTLTTVNLSGNGFTDKDAAYFARAILENNQIRSLNLSHNEFSEASASVLGHAIGENENIETLDLSWNHFRRKGGVEIIDAVKGNTRLKSVNLSWNGLGDEGAVGVGELLKVNNVILHLDISCNRFSSEGAAFISKGLTANETLKTFRLGKNAIGTVGALVILNAINNERSVLTTLDLSEIWVDKEFDKTEQDMKQSRQITIIHAGLLGNYVIKGPQKKDNDVFGSGGGEDGEGSLEDFLKNDPMAILKRYVDEKNLRLLDLFNQFDKDKNYRITREEFHRGIRQAKIGMTEEQIDALIRKLDVVEADGMIDYREMVLGNKELIDQTRKLSHQMGVNSVSLMRAAGEASPSTHPILGVPEEQ